MGRRLAYIGCIIAAEECARVDLIRELGRQIGEWSKENSVIRVDTALAGKGKQVWRGDGFQKRDRRAHALTPSVDQQRVDTTARRRWSADDRRSTDDQMTHSGSIPLWRKSASISSCVS